MCRYSSRALVIAAASMKLRPYTSLGIWLAVVMLGVVVASIQKIGVGAMEFLWQHAWRKGVKSFLFVV